jgi:4-hydroxybenzoyl-CoA reductase subunit beta
MIRLPRFRYHAPRSIEQATEILAGEGPSAMVLAGGTDLLPNMKRRQQTPTTLVALRDVEGMTRIRNGAGATIGAGTTLTDLLAAPEIRRSYSGLWQAVAQVATPHLRNMATLGGNLCLDTRCTYYDQSYEWRKAISFCMKKDGETCWVAPGSSRCLAVSSSDSAPALISLGAEVVLHSAQGQRVIAVDDLYRNDGIAYAVRRPDEILTEVRLPVSKGLRSTYWKLRRRGSFDFPVLGVAAAAAVAPDGTVSAPRVVLGAVASRPMVASAAMEFLDGKQLTDEVIAEAAGQASAVAKPMDNTDFTLHWRKRVASSFVSYALQELRGDPMDEVRRRIARQELHLSL